MGNSSSKRSKKSSKSASSRYANPSHNTFPTTYTAPTYVAPIHNTPTYVAPTYNAPTHTTPIYNPPLVGSSATPPSYNEVSTSAKDLGGKRTTSVEFPEDHALQTLAKYDIVFIVDDSLSMQGSRWQEATNALAHLVEKVSKYDDDGIDVYFLNNVRMIGNGLNSSKAVHTFFRSVAPNGNTPTGARLEKIVGSYLSRLEAAKRQYPDTYDEHMKPVVYIVITDGIPTDDPATIIEALARRLDRNDFPLSQVGIQFVQVGDDRQAAEHLRSLDDDLPKLGIRDIVDTTPYRGHDLTDDMLIKIMLGGINRRVDKT